MTRAEHLLAELEARRAPRWHASATPAASRRSSRRSSAGRRRSKQTLARTGHRRHDADRGDPEALRTARAVARGREAPRNDAPSTIGLARRSIRVLAPEVAARIAAGEVIERPVSVVRELLDNAIDAGATRITSKSKRAACRSSASPTTAAASRRRNSNSPSSATRPSKIAALDDLGHVHTLGFRGEALPSIAAAADVEIVSRVEAEPVGVTAVLVDGRVVRRDGETGAPRHDHSRCATSSCACRPAASSSARPAAKARQVVVLASHYALAYPGIAFHVVAGGRRALTTSGDGDLRHAFAAIYGAETAAAMLDVGLRGRAASA